jgi:predicted Zn-dependent protease
LGHEIAHALAHHSSERLAREQMTDRALQVANGALGSLAPDVQKRLIGLLSAGAQIHSLSYDRRQESEADHIGIFLMTFAGYDPDQAVPFWQRMQELSAKHGRPPTILSDHPSDAQRIAQMKAWIPAAKAAKQAYDRGRVAPTH